MSEVLTAEAPGVRITATPRGAHLLTWTTDGVERLWMSPLSGPDAPGAIRGGVPVLFPQFGAFGPLGKHGFARTTTWRSVAPATSSPDRAELSFELEDSEQTRAAWPHPFHARIDISAGATELEQALTVTNRGTDNALFTGGLHSYFVVDDPEAWIEGADGCHAWDGVSTEHPAFTHRLGARLRALDEQDLIITGVVAPLTLHDATLGDLTVSAEGFGHRVVWNPGPQHTLPDVEPGGEAHFVCIETTSVTPIHLAGESTWTGRQRLTVH
jgi:glucose-6-phosphate 1-epimerase